MTFYSRFCLFIGVDFRAPATHYCDYYCRVFWKWRPSVSFVLGVRLERLRVVVVFSLDRLCTILQFIMLSLIVRYHIVVAFSNVVVMCSSFSSVEKIVPSDPCWFPCVSHPALLYLSRIPKGNLNLVLVCVYNPDIFLSCGSA